MSAGVNQGVFAPSFSFSKNDIITNIFLFIKKVFFNEKQNKILELKNEVTKNIPSGILSNNQSKIDSLRRAGMTNECFKSHAERILETRLERGELTPNCSETLEKFIKKYAYNAEIAFAEMNEVGVDNELDKKIEGCLKAYTKARSVLLMSRTNNYEKHNEVANSIRRNLVELFKEKYPDMSTSNMARFIGGIS